MVTTRALPATANRAVLADYLADTYRRQLAQRHDDYLAAHAGTRCAILRQVDAFLQYLPYVEPRRVLDWGCRHSPDSCLIRKVVAQEVDLDGCDFYPLEYDAFYEASQLRVTPLSHYAAIPYEDGLFDTVIGSGVLEHVPNDSASLSELYRILRVGGRLILAFLPNNTSISEFVARRTGRTHHARLYSRREIGRMLLHHGFMPLSIRWHQVTPTLSGGAVKGGAKSTARSLADSLYTLNPILERVWGVRRLASNLLVIAEKRPTI